MLRRISSFINLNNMRKFILLIMLLSISRVGYSQYCIASGSVCDEYIGNVTVAGINNTSLCGLVNGYSNYTTSVPAGFMTPGLSYPVSVINPQPYVGDKVYIWIDWNSNFSFNDANESFVTSSTDNSLFTGTILCPATTPLGLKRMRIRITYNVIPGNPCGTEGFGEVEDYTINVTDGTPPPTINLNPLSQTACEGTEVSFSASASGSTSMQWQESPDNGLTWSNIPGANSSPLTFNASASQNGHLFRAGFSNLTGTTFTTSATLTVQTLPSVTVPGNITDVITPGQCGRSVTYTTSVTGSPAPSVSYLLTGATTGSGNGDGSGTFFNAGTTTVSITGSNLCGNDTESFTVTISDTEPPVITCPALLIVNCASSVPSPNPSSVTASDNCTVTVTHTGDVISNQTCNNRYIITRTYRATDGAGNFAVCNQIIIVNDQTPPVLSCPATLLVNCPGAVPVPDIATVTGVSDNCGGALTITFVSDVISNQTCANRYTINRKYRATDACGNTADCIQAIIVNDQAPPVLTCPAPITVNCPASVPAPDITAVTAVNDNCGGVVTITHAGDVVSNQTCANKYLITRKYRATDACGNFAECNQLITVNDQIAPVITCSPNITVTTSLGSCNATVNYSVTATDNCGGAVSITNVPASGSSFPLGVTTVTSTATDGCGNSSTCTFTITVLDGQIPVITTQPANKTICAGSNTQFTFVAIQATSYQWQQWNGSTWTDISGATSPDLTVNNAGISMNNKSFRAKVMGLCSTVFSNSAWLYVTPLPIVQLSASPVPVIMPGQTTSITATISPPGGNIVWLRDGIVISGATSPVLAGLRVDDLGTYKAIYTDLNGCTSTSVDEVVSGMYSEKLFVYPNPSRGKFQIRFYNSVNENVTVNIYDSKGSRIFNRVLVTSNITYSRMDVDISHLSAGLYIVEVLNSKEIRVGAKRIAMYR